MVFPGVPSPGQSPCGSFLSYGPALCPLSVLSLFSAYLVDGRSSTQFILLRIGSLGAIPFYLAYVCPFTLVFSFSLLYTTL